MSGSNILSQIMQKLGPMTKTAAPQHDPSNWKHYYPSEHPDNAYACRAIEYRYGEQNYDSGHDPDAPLSWVIIHFHDGMSRMIKV